MTPEPKWHDGWWILDNLSVFGYFCKPYNIAAMKLKLIITWALLLSLSTLSAQNVQAFLNYSVFNTPDNRPYIETYMNISGRSLTYMPLANGNWQGQLNVQVIFTLDDSIVDFAKYNLNSPEVKDSAQRTNLLDVQRYALPEGQYKMHFALVDVGNPGDTLSSFAEINIDFPDDEMVFSDIELLKSYEKGGSGTMEKNGFTLTPFVFNYFPENENMLSFYAELYHSHAVLQGEPFLFNFYIRPFEVDRKLDDYFKMVKSNPDDVKVVLSSFDITNLPSGNYLLVLEARDKNNALRASKELFFQRYNPNSQFNINSLMVLNTDNTFVGQITNRDTLVQYIKYLNPISTDMERNYVSAQLLSQDISVLRKYFLNFWTERDKMNPEKAWNDYLLLVKQANHNFKSISLDGYETDRGRVYLQYGQPNVISENYNEPAAYPYEIWQYYQLGDQHDKKFVFYSHDVVTNDFQLIHSNAIGELSNYRWQTVIYRRTWDPYGIDDDVIPDTYGSGATQNYRQPGSR